MQTPIQTLHTNKSREARLYYIYRSKNFGRWITTTISPITPTTLNLVLLTASRDSSDWSQGSTGCTNKRLSSRRIPPTALSAASGSPLSPTQAPRPCGHLFSASVSINATMQGCFARCCSCAHQLFRAWHYRAHGGSGGGLAAAVRASLLPDLRGETLLHHADEWAHPIRA
jgi:hypothetical protein